MSDALSDLFNLVACGGNNLEWNTFVTVACLVDERRDEWEDDEEDVREDEKKDEKVIERVVGRGKS